MRSRRFVFDTPSLVRALLLEGANHGRALLWARRNGRLLASPDTLDALSDELARPALLRYVDEEARQEVLRVLMDEALVVSPQAPLPDVEGLPGRRYLELALEGDAGVIVTDDLALCALDPFHTIRIRTTQAFLAHPWSWKGDTV